MLRAAEGQAAGSCSSSRGRNCWINVAEAEAANATALAEANAASRPGKNSQIKK